jgi:dephospho-CoA kinase
LKAFAKHGAATISSDEIVHAMLREDDDVKALLQDRWGDRIFDDIGQVQRAAVADIVFADPAELAWLEGLLHPRVELAYLQWREDLAASERRPSVCVTEIPLLYEVGADTLFDAVVVVTAPAETRWGRTAVRQDGRESRLISDEEKVRRAEFAYVNEGSLKDLDKWVIGVLAELRRRAAAAASSS